MTEDDRGRTAWRPSSGLPPVWVDLAREPAKLNYPGTVRDLARLGIEVRDGLVLNVWDYDGPLDGAPTARDDLIAMGQVYPDTETGEWLLRVIGDYRHVSDEAGPQ